MDFSPPLIEGVLVKRYKRFLADIILQDGREITAHCPNTGSMRGLTKLGSRVWLSQSASSGRKYPHTWEIVEEKEEGESEGVMVGVNTHNPNRIVGAALEKGEIPGLKMYTSIRREVPYGEKSRIDFLLEGEGRSPCYVEVKNVHYREGKTALFPDSPTTRGQKHMDELAALVTFKKARAIVFYLVQRSDCQFFDLGHAFDPLYAEKAKKAFDKEVEPLVYDCVLSPNGIHINKQLILKLT